MIGIYKVTNVLNNKVYIGQSQNISQRWIKHHNSPFNPNSGQYNTPFYRAIRQYGIDNFRFEVIEQCSIDDLNDREKYWIKYYQSNKNDKGYNLTDGGQGAITFSKITKNDVNQIIELLLTSSLSQEEISKKFNISQRQVSSINQGQSWLQEGVTYPLRSASEIQKRKKEKVIKTCPICGNPISPRATLCKNCNNKRALKVNVTREELKDLIRTTSFVEIGRQFGVSDNAIKKHCKKYNLPSTKKEIKQYTDEEWEKL